MNHFYRALLPVLFCLVAFSAQAQTVAFVQTASQPPAPPKVEQNRFFPFTVDEAGLTAKVNIREARVVQYYTPVFQKYQYAGSVQTWEDMVEELLAQKDLDFSIRNKITADSDKETLVFKASTRQEMDYFLQLVHPTFSVIANLEAFVKKVDPKHIDDGTHRAAEY